MKFNKGKSSTVTLKLIYIAQCLIDEGKAIKTYGINTRIWILNVQTFIFKIIQQTIDCQMHLVQILKDIRNINRKIRYQVIYQRGKSKMTDYACPTARNLKQRLQDQGQKCCALSNYFRAVRY